MANWTFELRVNGVAIDSATVPEVARYGPDTAVELNRLVSSVNLSTGDEITIWCTDRPVPSGNDWYLAYEAIRVRTV